MDVDSYVRTVRGRLSDHGFADEPAPDRASFAARKREWKLSRFSLVETVVVAGSSTSAVTPEDVRSFTTEVVDAALARKSRIPRGLGSSLVVYPLLVAGECPPETRAFMESYLPKHWCLVVFPVVVDARTGTLDLYEKTPVWGAFYQAKTRTEAKEWFGRHEANAPGRVAQR